MSEPRDEVFSVKAILDHKNRREPKPVRWMSPAPKECDICRVSLEKKDFVDGVTRMGPWGCMCLDCHSLYGRGLGTGKGQRYNGITLEKIGG